MPTEVRRVTGDDSVRVGIVDLMATAARGVAQAQFARLIESARQLEDPLDLSIVNMDPTDRSSAGTRADWDLIASFDAVIVTGAEPQTSVFNQDPSFAIVERILTVTAETAMSTVLSCLSAHAALEQMYSVRRHRLAEKCLGVMTHMVAGEGSLLTAGLPDMVTMPHSRWHSVHRSDLSCAGLTPLVVFGAEDWAVSTSPDGFRYIFLQGHPEYFADTLLREYRRDVRRFLAGISHTYPAVPTGYLPPADVEVLEAFMTRARRNRSQQTWASFPEICLHPDLGGTWCGPATTLATNWTSRLAGRTLV